MHMHAHARMVHLVGVRLVELLLVPLESAFLVHVVKVLHIRMHLHYTHCCTHMHMRISTTQGNMHMGIHAQETLIELVMKALRARGQYHAYTSKFYGPK
jgi:hypothetical protein